MMRRLLIIIIAIVLPTLFNSDMCADAATKNIKYSIAQISGNVRLKITRIDYRSDLTRIYAELIGQPHTACRIDDMTLVLPDGKSMAWTDIDGIDANRYFQWEDDGRIEIEIDFPPMKNQKSFVIKAKGPKGEYVWTIKRSK